MKTASYKLAICLFVAIVILPFSGCALFLFGSGAAGGYAVSRDTTEILMDKSHDQVWSALKETVKSEGAITLEDKDHGVMKAVVGKSEVEAKLDQVTEKTVRLRIRARRLKGFFPNIEMAQRLNNKVMQNLD